ncbi:MAG TPA: hypothetical protein VKP58_08140 [Candidatus Acidoferrum sp.]|nr:hypothetical protein [Candidatus Acidoferrum sp.]
MSKLVANFGRRGKGKTSLAYHQASRLGRGVCVFDPTESFSIGTIVSSREDFETALDLEISPIVFQVRDAATRKDAIEQDLLSFVQTIKYIRDIAVLIDETSYVQSPQWTASAFDDEVRVGRRRRHDVYFTQHRIADCNGILLSLVTEFNFFQTKYSRDLDRIAEICGDRIAGLVSQLGEHDFLHYDVEQENSYINVEPDSWRVSLSPEVTPQTHLSVAAA